MRFDLIHFLSNLQMFVECLVSACLCGSKCSNRRVQKGKKPRTKVVDCGIKGLGMIALEKIDVGEFVDEYTGEIVTENEYQLRQLVSKLRF